MALKGLDIFKLTPKKNCKECGSPTCMAFAMKVAQGAVQIDQCPYMGDDVKAQLSEATAPPMKSIEIGQGDTAHKLGGETVLFRHEKTLVSKNLFAVSLNSEMEETQVDEAIDRMKATDYERINERMYVETIYLEYDGKSTPEKYAFLVKKAAETGRTLILGCTDESAAKAALDVCAGGMPVLNGATAENYEKMNRLASDAGVVLGVRGGTIDEIYTVLEALEKLGNKKLVVDVTGRSVKEAYANAVQLRRASVKDGDRTCGYPSLVNVAKLAQGDMHLQTALASAFILKYGSIIVMSEMTYAEALPLYGLRQNIYTDPQKPMRVEPGIYPINGADENSPCAITVDFALTYFVVSGEFERAAKPVNLLITDAGGYSVLTAWAAGKLSAGSISKFMTEGGIEEKIKNRKLIIPGKVAVLKGEIQEKLPGWDVVVGTNEAVQIVNFMKQFK